MSDLIERTNKRTETHACDCISRKAAIDGADKIIERDTSGNNDVVKAMAAWKEWIKGLPSAQPESTADAEFWRKRADYYSDMCSKLIADMGAGVKIEAVKIDETGITFTKKKPSAQADRSLWFRIGEICVDESKGFISAGRAVEKIRELLREAERREE